MVLEQMVRGNRIEQREHDSEESDEEYRMSEDEECDELDEFESLDGHESDELLPDFGESRKDSRSRNIRKTSSGKKVDGIMKARKRRKVVDTKNDNDDDGGDDDEDDHVEFVSSGGKRNQRRKLLVYTDDDDIMYSGMKLNHKKNLQEKRKLSYTQDDDDDDDSGCMYPCRMRNQINASTEKRTCSYKENNQEDEDENDAEFKLNESDFIDDEDSTPKLKITNKVSRSSLHKKSKKSKSKLKDQNMKTSKRQKQKEITESDSDFVNSVNYASSDHEYTISEEEREQKREARVYCADLRDKLRRPSCDNHEQRKYPIQQGKEKIADMKEEISNQVCGICLSEERKRTVRGVLNCCQHYFCFSCIMEWSKVESRCPLCKQRFATIAKAAKSVFDSRTVVISVPERDQVYEPSEEELRGHLDPYENVICTECHNGGNDALMLLCDICDSSAHTYCVGLGCEVPEGNWYCGGCKPTVFGTLKASDLSSPLGFDLNELYVPESETPLTQQPRVVSEHVLAFVGNVATTLRDRRRVRRHMHHHLLSNIRTGDLVGRSGGPLASSSGIRLFGSRFDLNDRIIPSQN